MIYEKLQQEVMRKAVRRDVLDKDFMFCLWEYSSPHTEDHVGVLEESHLAVYMIPKRYVYIDVPMVFGDCKKLNGEKFLNRIVASVSSHKTDEFRICGKDTYRRFEYKDGEFYVNERLLKYFGRYDSLRYEYDSEQNIMFVFDDLSDDVTPCAIIMTVNNV